MEAEFKTVMELTGADRAQIKFCDQGYKSRAYIIGEGEIVFKFRRYQNVNYDQEVKNLAYLRTLHLELGLPQVGWRSESGEYLGLYGVQGNKLCGAKFEPGLVGASLGKAVAVLHSAKPANFKKTALPAEVAAWQKRYHNARTLMQNYFEQSEIERLDEIMDQDLPHDLATLGEKLVLSHGDLSEGNIILSEQGEVGVIDWGDMAYLDEAADFMDIEDNRICDYMLDYYQADEVLRQKVQLRRQVRPIFVFGDCVRKDERNAKRLMRQVRERALGR